MKKSLARPLLHDTPRQPLTQVNGYNGRNVYRIEQHLKLQCGAGLNGQSLKDGPKQRHRDGIAEFTQGHKMFFRACTLHLKTSIPWRNCFLQLKAVAGFGRDREVFGLLIVKDGRGGQTNCKPLQHHDYINFPSLSKEGISSSAAEFYTSGLSLRQISQHLNKSKSFIRKTLLEAGVSLRQSVESQPSESSAPPKLHSGNTPFGYRNLRGRLIMDAREIEIVHSIMELWTRGKSYSAIAAHLNGLGLKNRRATRLENIHSCAP